ncbi:hypothetical protein TCON_2708 [Astathelohania contejeani]|uniref:Uncharacterized protein n=1 Tax=Astathelohania contejeani TaxID=164912 RepID=A0ABQ7HV85_9MICR|nr:hypothetical protein TCON_2708 [Thelohania contejeani]
MIRCYVIILGMAGYVHGSCVPDPCDNTIKTSDFKRGGVVPEWVGNAAFNNAMGISQDTSQVAYVAPLGTGIANQPSGYTMPIGVSVNQIPNGQGAMQSMVTQNPPSPFVKPQTGIPAPFLNNPQVISSGFNPQIPQSPVYFQPPGNKQFANKCDDSYEGDEFKKCVADALKNLRNLLKNCRKALGPDAPECCIDNKCLDSLKAPPPCNPCSPVGGAQNSNCGSNCQKTAEGNTNGNNTNGNNNNGNNTNGNNTNGNNTNGNNTNGNVPSQTTSSSQNNVHPQIPPQNNISTQNTNPLPHSQITHIKHADEAVKESEDKVSLEDFLKFIKSELEKERAAKKRKKAKKNNTKKKKVKKEESDFSTSVSSEDNFSKSESSKINAIEKERKKLNKKDDGKHSKHRSSKKIGSRESCY